MSGRLSTGFSAAFASLLCGVHCRFYNLWETLTNQAPKGEIQNGHIKEWRIFKLRRHETCFEYLESYEMNLRTDYVCFWVQREAQRVNLTGRQISTQDKEALSSSEGYPTTGWADVWDSRLPSPGSIHGEAEYHLPWRFGRRFIPGCGIVSCDLSDPFQLWEFLILVQQTSIRELLCKRY